MQIIIFFQILVRIQSFFNISRYKIEICTNYSINITQWVNQKIDVQNIKLFLLSTFVTPESGFINRSILVCFMMKLCDMVLNTSENISLFNVSNTFY